MKSLPNIAAACFGIFAGCLLTLASWERPETNATPAQPTLDPIVLTTTEVDGPCPWVAPEETVTPLTPSVDAQDVVASASATGDCANGTCSAPRAASVRRYQPVRSQRSGLLSRLRIRR